MHFLSFLVAAKTGCLVPKPIKRTDGEVGHGQAAAGREKSNILPTELNRGLVYFQQSVTSLVEEMS